jgi:hypothetical protein
MTPATFRRIVRERDGRCQGVDLLPDIACWGIPEVNHLKNRSQCTAAEKVNPHNGVLLCTAHHAWVTGHSLKARALGLHLEGWEEVPEWLA